MAETADASTPVPATEPVGKPAPRPAQRPLSQWEVVGAGAAALAVMLIAFGVLARMYYFDKVQGRFFDLSPGLDLDELAGEEATRLMWDAMFFGYLTFAVLTCAAVTAAVLRPRLVAHALVGLFGLAYIASAIAVFTQTRMPVTIPIFQAAIGGLLLWLGAASWQNKDRAAWAFLMSLCGVLALLLTFGAPQLREAMGEPRLWYVMILPAQMAAIVVGLYRTRNDYV
jgi:hypothetical protein